MTYGKSLEKLEQKAEATLSAMEKREAKAESLRAMITSYQIALSAHEAFIEERRVKSQAEQRILGELRLMVPALHEEISKEFITYDPEEDVKKLGYVRDPELVKRWDKLWDDFNKVYYGRGGSLLTEGGE